MPAPVKHVLIYLVISVIREKCSCQCWCLYHSYNLPFIFLHVVTVGTFFSNSRSFQHNLIICAGMSCKQLTKICCLCSSTSFPTYLPLLVLLPCIPPPLLPLVLPDLVCRRMSGDVCCVPQDGCEPDVREPQELAGYLDGTTKSYMERMEELVATRLAISDTEGKALS